MKDGLLMAYLLDGAGGGTQLNWEQIQAWRPEDGLLWMHLDYSDERVVDWIQQQSGLDEVSVDILLANETRPRYTLLRDGLLTILRGVNLNPGADPEDMVSVRILVSGSRIISCRKRPLAVESDLMNLFRENTGPKNSGEFLATMADLMIFHVGDVIEDIDALIDDLTDQLLAGNTIMLRTQLADTKRTIIKIRRYLSPQREALVRLSNAETDILSSRDRAWLREVADETIRYLEDLDEARDRTTVSQEELSHRLSEQTEKRIYLLAIITAIFMPIGLITGLLGINVGGIPGAVSSNAFMIVCGMIFIIILIELIILKTHKWF